MTTALCTWLALGLAVVAGLKAWRSQETARALATYGIVSPRAQLAGVWALVTLELCLAAALILRAPGAATATAALFAAFALASTAALLAGRAGRPCACFGTSSTLDARTPLRACALAALAGLLASGLLPDAPSGYARWMTAGLSVSLAAVVLLAVALLALAREVGVLRIGMNAQAALELDGEGPQLGATQTWASIPAPASALVLLAIFTSEGCPLCHQLTPAIAHVSADPRVAVQVFDEAAHAAVWRQAAAPGSPYAVALSTDAVALAKGTFNSLGQLESILATARAREGGLSLAA